MDPLQDAIETLLKGAGLEIVDRSENPAEAWTVSTSKPRVVVVYAGTTALSTGEGSVNVSTYIAQIVTAPRRYLKPLVDKIVTALEDSKKYQVIHPITADLLVPPITDPEDTSDIVTVTIATTEGVV